MARPKSLTRQASKPAKDDVAQNAATETPPAKRPRGRPSRASLLAASRDSLSSVPASANYSSASDYSTPLTSNVATPAPSFLDGKPGHSSTRASSRKIEVVIPAAKSRESNSNLQGMAIEKANRKSLLNLSTKRKRQVINDSEDDFSDDDPNAQRTRHDEQVARQLQAEMDKASAQAIQDGEDDDPLDLSDAPLAMAKGKGKAVAYGGGRATRAKNKAFSIPDSQDEDDEDDEDFGSSDVVMTTRKGKGKAVASPISIRGRRAANKVVAVPDSEDDDMFSVYDSGEDGPPPKKLRATRGKRNVPAQSTRGRPKRLVAPTPENVSLPTTPGPDETATSDGYASPLSSFDDEDDDDDDADDAGPSAPAAGRAAIRSAANARRGYGRYRNITKEQRSRDKLEKHHPELKTMWTHLKNSPILKAGKADQPKSISRQLKPFQLEGLAWMMAMEKTEWKGGLLGDEMGLGKTIQAVSLIMSDWPAKQPTLVLVPPVALMQWVSEIDSYTDGTLKTLVFHGTNAKSKGLKIRDLKKYDVIMMSYNSLESMYRKQEKGFTRKDGIYKEKSIIHATQFHRVILDEAHCIKTRTTMTAKACFALKVDYRWCLSGTPLQNRIGEFFSLIRFLNVKPFASYFCKQCPCSSLEWSMDDNHRCTGCNHNAMQHVSVFNQELLNPIQRYGNKGAGAEAFQKLRLMTDRIMLRRLKKDHTDSMELPVKEIYVDRQFFGEEENDFANSIMTSGQRKFDTYVAQGVMLNNYANIFGLIMQMRQVADHPDLILKKDGEGGQNILVCCICDEPAEEAIRSRCKHDFCRSCAKGYLDSQEQPDCPQCHIPLSIDLDQPAIEQDEASVKKSSIINRIKMENWTSSSKIELLVHELHKLRSDNSSHKSIIFSQFTTMLQLIEWRLRRAGITTVMLDGSMTPAQRAASIDHFMKNVEVECFLVSLKAGGVALNLVEASRVFIIDPWWNPAAEWQSADRCHRIGQTRPCTITRLCIEDSVESRMVLLQEKKANMINSTINSDDAAMESLTPEDLQFLFRGS